MTRDRPWARRFADILQQQPPRVFTRDELGRALLLHHADVAAPSTLRVSRLIQILIEETGLREIQITREGRTGNIDTKTRYAWGEVSAYAIGASLISGAYLSHASAVFLHALTDQVPKTIYVNREQALKPLPSLALSQVSINRAFKRPARRSTYVFTSAHGRFVFLSGKYSGRLEVAPLLTPNGEIVDATKLERTLIDIVVRPAYAGGPHEVLRAYQTAAPRLSVTTLVATLRKLDYVYPYHQAIGFLLERAGVPEPQLAKLAALGLQWDFYLAHQLASPAYDSRWRLFHPEGM